MISRASHWLGLGHTAQEEEEAAIHQAEAGLAKGVLQLGGSESVEFLREWIINLSLVAHRLNLISDWSNAAVNNVCATNQAFVGVALLVCDRVRTVPKETVQRLIDTVPATRSQIEDPSLRRLVENVVDVIATDDTSYLHYLRPSTIDALKEDLLPTIDAYEARATQELRDAAADADMPDQTQELREERRRLHKCFRSLMQQLQTMTYVEDGRTKSASVGASPAAPVPIRPASCSTVDELEAECVPAHSSESTENREAPECAE